ncbi:MAG: glutathione S-transferase [Rubrivivax sp.]|nr:glutathione S-transferase [Rubrivivax sp.]
MITLHHLENSRSQRVLWLLEELGVPYDVKRYARDPKTMYAPPELAKVHPLGKSPVITDGDVTVAESGAIIEYLLDEYDREGRLRPLPGSPERRRFTYWLHFAEGSAMPPLLMKLVFDKVRRAKVPFFIKPVVRGVAEKVTENYIAPNLARQFRFMEDELATRPWFAGRTFSAADIQMSFPLEAAAARGGLDDAFPKLMDWLQRIHARPAYHRALQAGGPYTIID